MQTASQLIQAAIESGEIGKAGLQPSPIFTRAVDHSRVTEYTSCHVNDAWAPKIKELLEGGWVLFLMQTELSFGIGHVTMAYMAKLKTN
jgi:hypothetical protein